MFIINSFIEKNKVKEVDVMNGTYCFRIQLVSVLRQNIIHPDLVDVCDEPEPPGKQGFDL